MTLDERDSEGGEPVENPVAVNMRVEQGRIGLAEGTDVDAAVDIVRDAPVPDSEWVTAVEGGLVVFTAAPNVEVSFRVQVLDEPDQDTYLGAFEDVVELSYTARSGPADVVVPGGDPQVAAYGLGFPGPGPVRARVHATELWPGGQLFLVQLWAAPEAPARVLRTAADVAAARAAGPERAYAWIENSTLEQAACLTFVPGATREHVLSAFGADPSDPTGTVAWSQRCEAFPDLELFVAVLDVPGGVVAVEDNRWLGSHAAVLAAASRGGRAASAFWNVNGVHRLGFARGGTLLSSTEFGVDTDNPDLDPEIAAAVAGIDVVDVHAPIAKDVLAATRFTGLTLRPGDLDTLEATGRAHRITPPTPP